MVSTSAAGTSGTKESSLTTLISFLDSRNIPYFYKVMTKTAVTQIVLGPVAYALGFPVRFVRAHGTNIGDLATFQPTNCDRTWPIKITVRDEPLQVFAYGTGGWKAFVLDNGIQVGDTLVFSLVGVSRFMIDIIKAAPPAETHEEEAHEEGDPSLDPVSSPDNIPEEVWVPCKRCRKVTAPPRFVKNVTPTDVNQLAVPADFWECFRDMLQYECWELKGPNGVVMIVEAEGTFYEGEQKLYIHLKSGWKEFFIANDLRVHDVLEFSLVGSDAFTVHVQRL